MIKVCNSEWNLLYDFTAHKVKWNALNENKLKISRFYFVQKIWNSAGKYPLFDTSFQLYSDVTSNRRILVVIKSTLCKLKSYKTHRHIVIVTLRKCRFLQGSAKSELRDYFAEKMFPFLYSFSCQRANILNYVGLL